MIMMIVFEKRYTLTSMACDHIDSRHIYTLLIVRVVTRLIIILNTIMQLKIFTILSKCRQ